MAYAGLKEFLNPTIPYKLDFILSTLNIYYTKANAWKTVSLAVDKGALFNDWSIEISY
jgi:hypothetical protein